MDQPERTEYDVCDGCMRWYYSRRSGEKVCGISNDWRDCKAYRAVGQTGRKRNDDDATMERRSCSSGRG